MTSASPNAAPGAAPPLPDAAALPAYGEDSLARLFAVLHGARLRHVGAWRCWMAWDGARWRRDDQGLAFNLARETCRIAANGARDPARKGGNMSCVGELSAAGLFGMVERLARSDPRVTAEPGLWDPDRDLLNTPAGIVDTRTGATAPHRADAWITRITGTAPAAPGTQCPLWYAFLDRITAGDAALQTFLQRIAGYALTGHTGEHALFFAYGTGANGKSTFITTLMRVLGDYAEAAPIETFVARSRHGLAADLARLGAARLVTAHETEDGRPWAEARIKTLTGGDPVAGRSRRQGGATFTPRFKLLFAGNRTPTLSGVDEAMRRRFHLLPFAVTIPEAERDPALLDRLVPEHPAILRWAIDGALLWRAVGLAPPDAVRQATRLYLDAEDTFGLWLHDCAEAARRAWTSSSDLYASWKAWAQAHGETVGSQKRLGQLLQARGFETKRLPGGNRGFGGLRLMPPTPAAAGARENNASDASQRVTTALADSSTSHCSLNGIRHSGPAAPVNGTRLT